MNPQITLAEVIALIVLSMLIIGASVFCGYKYEKNKYDQFVTQVKSEGQKQATKIAALNKQLEDNANEATKTITDSTTAISDYYHKHPVVKYAGRVCNASSGSSAVPGPNDNTQGSNDSASSDNATTYISQYSPYDTEIVANRLDKLQKLLIKDGVTVE